MNIKLEKMAIVVLFYFRFGLYLIPFEVAWEDVGPGDLFCLEAWEL